MAKQTIGIGTVANDGTGDTIRDSFSKANDNFTELYNGPGGATLDTDGTLAANSDTRVATQKAVKTAIAAAVTGLLDLKGTTDCSANPNYPAASKGDYYVVTVAGKIGGASGSTVAVGDVYFATADNAGGTQASVGASWDILVHASVAAGGGLLAANNLSDLASAPTARTNMGVAIGTDVQAHSTKLDAIAANTVTTDSSTARTAALGDADTFIRFTSSSAVTFTIPPNSSVAFPVGTQIEFSQSGTGVVSAAAGAGVTINSRSADLTLAGQYAVAFVKKVATDTWIMNGDL